MDGSSGAGALGGSHGLGRHGRDYTTGAGGGSGGADAGGAGDTSGGSDADDADDETDDVARAFAAWDDMEAAEEVAVGLSDFGDRAKRRRDRRRFGDELEATRDRREALEIPSEPPMTDDAVDVVAGDADDDLPPSDAFVAGVQVFGLLLAVVVGVAVVMVVLSAFGTSVLPSIGGAFAGVLGTGGTWRAYERMVFEGLLD